MIRRAVETVSTSQADNAAYRALADVSAIIEHVDDARIVGGQMVALLLEAFPSAGVIPRRTADADTAVSTTVAGSGLLHTQLTASGYEATSGNSYSRGDQSVDVLIPASAGRFAQEEHGGRVFDAVPGIQLALSAAPIILDVNVTLLDGSLLRFETRVPTPEIATILKAYAIRDRLAAKDAVDLHNLLSLADATPREGIGGWRLADPNPRGARLDTARTLHTLAYNGRRNPALRNSGVIVPRLVALIRRHIARPS